MKSATVLANPAAFFRSRNVRIALALLLPFAVCVLQWLLWPQIGPSRWFLFYPIAFFAPLIGGLAGGIGATLVSVLLVWYFFLPPQFSWQLVEPGSPIAILVFLASGITFAFFHQRLRDREQKYRMLFSRAGDGIAVADAQGRFVDVNPTACAMLGRARVEIVGAKVESMFANYTQDDWNAVGTRLRATGWATFERRLRRFDGSILAVEVTVTPLRSGSRLAIWRDIDERNRLQAALHASEERLRYAMDAANEGLWDADVPTGSIVVNDHWFVQFGYAPGEVQPTTEFWRSSIYPDDAPTTGRLVEDYLQGRSTEYRLEHRIMTKSGEVRWHRSVGKAVAWDADGKPLRMVGTNTDITDRKAAEQQLQEANVRLELQVAARTADLEATVAELHRANAGKDAFIASVSHELRTPLTGILTMSELLQTGVRGALNPAQRQYVTSIHTSGVRLLDTVNSILLYTSLMADAAPLAHETCRLHELCTAAVHAVKPKAEAKQQHIIQRVDDIDLRIVSDPQAIRQVLQELLDNAVKFTPNGGTIDLVVTPEPTTASPDGTSPATLHPAAVRIVVADTGIGMDAEQLAAIFLPFTQGDQTLARRFEGIGLGLAYVHEVVTRLGGTITAAAEPGRGSRFTIILPSHS
ncbi:MAG: PAS domain S-box protein [Caldilineaceae bacterium]